MAVHTELHDGGHGAKLNWLRAAVLGANDGIVSVASLVVGVAGATSSIHSIMIAGVAGLVAGAFAMAIGEYVSVSSQRDTEDRLLEKERWELENEPEHELRELADIYEQKGLSKGTAQKVAEELTAHDAFGAHAEAELHIDPNELTNAWHAAIASGLAFTAGAIVPLLTIVLTPESIRIPLTFVAVLVALAITGALSARVSDAGITRVVVRIILGGALAMAATFGIGKLFGAAVA